MICSNCVREVPDGSSFCPRCGNALSPADSVPLPEAASEIHALLDEQGAYEPIVPEPEYSNSRGWEQTGRFESAVHSQARLPAYSVFSAKGRLNRLKYWYFMLFENIAIYIVYFGVMFHINSASVFTIPLLIVYFALLALFIVLRVFATIKRFHDIDEPGINVLTTFIPFYNIYVGCKLLFKGSVQGDGAYGGTVRNHWYWQAPATLLLVPILYFGACFGLTGDSPVTAMLTGNMGNRQYYNEQYGVGITFPAGWRRTEVDGCMAAAQNWSGSQIITLEMASAEGAVSFDEYTDDNYAAFIEEMDDIEEFASRFGLNADDISKLSCSRRDINGKTFVQAGFRQSIESVDCRHIFVMGIYYEEAIVVQLVLPDDAPGNVLDVMMESADSLVVDMPAGE